MGSIGGQIGGQTRDGLNWRDHSQLSLWAATITLARSRFYEAMRTQVVCGAGGHAIDDCDIIAGLASWQEAGMEG